MSDSEQSPLDEMTLEELRNEYRRMDPRELNAMKDPEEWERYHSLWNELLDRTDVQQPECPDCGARDWGQALDNPPHCRECQSEVHPEMGVDPEVYETQIHATHRKILGGHQGDLDD